METKKTNSRDTCPNESNVFTLGEHLQDLLDWVNEEYGLSMREFAQKSGISVSQLSEVLNGKRNMSPLMALKIEKATGTPHASWAALQWTHEVDKVLMKEGTAENDWKHDPSLLSESLERASA